MAAIRRLTRSCIAVLPHGRTRGLSWLSYAEDRESQRSCGKERRDRFTPVAGRQHGCASLLWTNKTSRTVQGFSQLKRNRRRHLRVKARSDGRDVSRVGEWKSTHVDARRGAYGRSGGF